jgi:hypothetical protein
MLTAMLNGVSALGAGGVGHAVVDQLEVIVLPMSPEPRKQQLAS